MKCPFWIVALALAGLLAAPVSAQSAAGPSPKPDPDQPRQSDDEPAATPPQPSQLQATQPKRSTARTMPEHVEEIKADIERIRKLEYKNDRVPVRRKDVEEYRRHLKRHLNAMYPPDRREGIIEGLARLGMINRDTDLQKHLFQAHLAQASAYYDPRLHQVNFLVTALPRRYMRNVLANRLTKALIDQHYDIDSITRSVTQQMNDWPRPHDRLLATEFLLEGEAAYVQLLWQFEQMGAPMASDVQEEDSLRTMAQVGVRQLLAGVSSEVDRLTQGGRNQDHPVIEAMRSLEDRPTYILDPMYAAQMKGAYFVSVLKRGDGWDAIARAHENPPVSTEQTLHPKKLFWEPDLPTEIKLPQFESLRNSGWTLIDSAIHGELLLQALLGLYEAERFDAMGAAAGWDGDIYQAWKSSDGRIGIVLATTWDSENDASEFFESYLGILSNKYPQLVQHDIGDHSMVYECGGGAIYGWGWIVKRGREVFAIEGFDRDTGDDLLEQLKALDIEHVD